MRRATAWIVVVGVVVSWAGGAAPARALEPAPGFWVSLAAGLAGSPTPSDSSEFWFDSPHAPPVAVTALSGAINVKAETAGGSTFFSGAGTPVLLPTGNGYATLTDAGAAAPADALTRFAGAAKASGSPQTGNELPLGDAARLTAGLSDPVNGSRVLSVGLTDAAGNPLGQGQVTVPDGGWWVVGLGPGEKDVQPEPEPVPLPVPQPGSGGGSTVATPEPASVVLVGLGGLTAAGWRRLRRR